MIFNQNNSFLCNLSERTLPVLCGRVSVEWKCHQSSWKLGIWKGKITSSPLQRTFNEMAMSDWIMESEYKLPNIILPKVEGVYSVFYMSLLETETQASNVILHIDDSGWTRGCRFEMLILFLYFLLLFSLVPPKIYDISSDITVNEGSNVSLICSASGKPEPTIYWRHITPLGEFTSPLTWLC